MIQRNGRPVIGFALGGSDTEICALPQGVTPALGTIATLGASMAGAVVGSKVGRNGALVGAMGAGVLASTIAASTLDKIQHPDCGSHPSQGKIIVPTVISTTIAGGIGAAIGRSVSRPRKKDHGTIVGAVVGLTLGGAMAATAANIFCWSCKEP